ncbi:MAG: hypothetical protein E7473_07925 [Ruminococcaceae bacterium]|nr:hypothetical protein [Oscillospiraceae bacterium]
MKRFISLMLTAAMLFALLPVVPSASAEVGDEIVVEFSSVTTTLGATNADPEDWTRHDGYEVIQEESNYTSAGMASVAGSVETPEGTKNLFKLITSGGTAWPAGGATQRRLWFTFKFKVAEEGYYEVKFQGGKYNQGAEYFLYVDDLFAGEYSCFDASASAVKLGEEKKLNTLYLTPDSDGYVKATFRTSVKAPGNTNFLIPYKLTLTKVEEAPSFASFEETIPESVEQGEEVKVTVSAKMSDGSTYSYPTYKIDGTSDSRDSLSVSVSGDSILKDAVLKDGVYSATLKAGSVGDTTVSMQAKIGGVQTPVTTKTVEILDASIPREVSALLIRDNFKFTDSAFSYDTVETKGFTIVKDKSTIRAQSRCQDGLKLSINGVMTNFVEMNLGNKSAANVWPKGSNATKGSVFTVAVNVPVAGKYSLKLQAIQRNTSLNYYVYVNDKYAGDYESFYENATSAGQFRLSEEETLNTFYLPKGENEISFRLKQAPTNSNGVQIIPYSIRFVPVEDQSTSLEPESISAEIPENLALGQSIDVDAKVIMNDGSLRLFGLSGDGTNDDNNKVDIEITNPIGVEVIEKVSSSYADGKTTFNLKANALGSAKVKITALVDGKPVSTEEKVIDVVDIKAVNVSFGRNPLPEGYSSAANLEIILSNDDIYSGDYDVTFESSDTSVIEIDPETGVATAVANNGSAEISARVSLSGMEKTGTVILSATDAIAQEETVVYFTEKTTSTNTSETWVNPYLWTTEGYTIIREETYEDDVSGAGRYYGAKLQTPEGPLSIMQIRSRGGKTWPSTNDKTVMFTITVPMKAKGYYNIKFQGGKGNAFSDYYIYADGKYAGEYSFYDPDFSVAVLGEEKQLNTLYLDPGEKEYVKISFRVAKTRYSSTYMLPYKLTFTPVAEKPVISELESEIQDEFVPGEDMVIESRVKMSDGSYHYFGKYDGDGNNTDVGFNVASEDDNTIGVTSPVLSATDSSLFTFTIKPKAAKSEAVSITQTASFDGVEKSLSKSVTVSDDPLERVEVSLEAAEVLEGDSTRLIVKNILQSGRELGNTSNAVTTFTASEETLDIADVSGDILRTYKEGMAKINVKTVFAGQEKDVDFIVNVLPEGMTEVSATAGGYENIRFTGNGDDHVPFYVQAISNLGAELDTSDAIIEATAHNPEIADLNEARDTIIPKAPGKAKFTVRVTLNGRTRETEATFTVSPAKRGFTYITEEKRENAKNNIQKYSWAKDEAKKKIATADKYVDNVDALYGLITSQGLMRSMAVGEEYDANILYCRYCGENIGAENGTFPWVINPITRPWKVQCPDCKRVFPTNDFESFYKLGLNQYGEFDRLRALEAHREMLLAMNIDSVTESLTSVEAPGKENTTEWYTYYGYGVKEGYLYNSLYREVGDEGCPVQLSESETKERWGVDDGLGYYSGKTKASNGNNDRHTYIGCFIASGLWRSDGAYGKAISEAIQSCAYAYVYTGEKKYGVVAAVLLDRLADFYPDYDLKAYDLIAYNAHGGSGVGGLLGNIAEAQIAPIFPEAYDMVYDIFDDPTVVNYIAKKGENIKFRHAKETPNQIRHNIENGLLRGILRNITNGRVAGNFGLAQEANALCAVVLDSQPETTEWIDFLYASNVGSTTTNVTGGGIDDYLISRIDRDGQGDEASTYNQMWIDGMQPVADVLDGYDGYEGMSLYEHPKMKRMYYSGIAMMLGEFSPTIGDTSRTAQKGHWTSKARVLNAFHKIGDPIFAQAAYEFNGRSVEGFNTGIWTENPEQIQNDILDVIKENGPLTFRSDMLAGFGVGMLRSGGDYTDSTAATALDTRNATWMYFGTNGNAYSSHAHKDTLNIGLIALGLELMPDHGYPTKTGQDPERVQWTNQTLSHNTVMVNEKSQEAQDSRGDAIHFDETDMVRVMDVSEPNVYNEVSEYRRSVLNIKIDDENMYMVDFFRVLGGDNHIYSIHVVADGISETVGMGEVKPQTDENGNYIGSYAGADVPFGADPNTNSTNSSVLKYPRGYTWLDNVDRYGDTEDNFTVDFKIRDWKKYLKDGNDLYLRMTVLDGENRENGVETSVAIANGYPPAKKENLVIDYLKYFLLEHKGENLDAVFTTVFEPYKKERSLEKSEPLKLEIIDGSENADDAARGIKVTHTSGRIDYIFWATNNTVTYKAEDGERTLYFRGFTGVYTLGEKNGSLENTHKYILDGDIIGEALETEDVVFAVTGKVHSFTKTVSYENEMTVETDSEISEETLAQLPGKYIFVDNSGEEYARNGAYRIESAAMDGNKLTLSVGEVSFIRKYVDSKNPELGYVFNIKEGQDVRIPLSYSEDFSPVFDEIDELSASAGSGVSFTVKAESELGEKITYSENVLPRGASLNGETGAITWKPQSSQVGRNHFAITATDESGRQSTLHFFVNVYGSTSGGGGGGTTAPSDKPSTDVGEDIILPPAEPDVRFTDLASHAWAEDAINALADKGIIKGTSETTYSPANNITRADFAILLVRAFEKESDNTENFADVSESDYFAKELAIARNTGLVGGIGANLFAPRDNIKRCDMMLMVYRVLKDKFVGEDIIRPQYEDFDTVPDYAKEAVSALIGAGLVNGKNNKIAPNDNTTRAEVAVLLQRVLEFVEK